MTANLAVPIYREQIYTTRPVHTAAAGLVSFILKTCWKQKINELEPHINTSLSSCHHSKQLEVMKHLHLSFLMSEFDP